LREIVSDAGFQDEYMIPIRGQFMGKNGAGNAGAHDYGVVSSRGGLRRSDDWRQGSAGMLNAGHEELTWITCLFGEDQWLLYRVAVHAWSAMQKFGRPCHVWLDSQKKVKERVEPAWAAEVAKSA